MFAFCWKNDDITYLEIQQILMTKLKKMQIAERDDPIYSKFHHAQLQKF